MITKYVIQEYDVECWKHHNEFPITVTIIRISCISNTRLVQVVCNCILKNQFSQKIITFTNSVFRISEEVVDGRHDFRGLVSDELPKSMFGILFPFCKVFQNTSSPVFLGHPSFTNTRKILVTEIRINFFHLNKWNMRISWHYTWFPNS